MDAKEFTRIGRLLYGPHWKSAMAGALDVALRTIHRLSNGDSPIQDGIARDIATLCEEHGGVLIEEAKRLRKTLPRRVTL